MGSFSIWHWLIVLAIVTLIFGTKKLRNVGADLGGAVKGFKEGIKEATTQPGMDAVAKTQLTQGTLIDGVITAKSESSAIR